MSKNGDGMNDCAQPRIRLQKTVRRWQLIPVVHAATAAKERIAAAAACPHTPPPALIALLAHCIVAAG